MAKASLKLPSGTTVAIEGSPEEVHQILEFYGAGSSVGAGGRQRPKKQKVQKRAEARVKKEKPGEHEVNLTEIVNLVKNCDEAESIETEILDRTSQVNRVLLPLYVVHEHMENDFGLTTGEVSKISTDLGIPISQANVAHAVAGTASRYVISDQVRKRGRPVRYKLSRRGVKYLKDVLKGSKSDK